MYRHDNFVEACVNMLMSINILGTVKAIPVLIIAFLLTQGIDVIVTEIKLCGLRLSK